MARTKKHKLGWKQPQAKAQGKATLKSAPVSLDRSNLTEAATGIMATDSKANPLDDSARPTKRVKTTDSDADQSPQFADQYLRDSTNPKARADSTPNQIDRALPDQLQPLRAKYDFVTMSIVSSSGIQQKVRSLLDHMAKLSFADPRAKPGVVILHAKGNVAGKMISIVEIAKREIEKERGCWWQYSSVHAENTELKELQVTKGPQTEKTLLENQEHHKDDADSGMDEAQQAMTDSKTADGPCPVEEEDYFESMGQGVPHEVVPLTEETEARKKIRSIPVMTTYMSRVPVAALKQAYGEQTNG
ncbi:DNA/RNA-binding protein Alba-like [Lasallia pustulata]|uniref:DNA/RNA-binding protein Alba-like n=1 Tax=Lasallia pustulata TaxID=136370 RepID=A0A1W5DCP6_9LECA|nr:DNA/RNA-binding protein Alba-like [Lasallia pustulata]